MQNIRELYILGKPIDTPLGRCHFIEVQDYDELLVSYQYLNKEKQEMINDIGLVLMDEQEKGKLTLDEVRDAILEYGKLNILELIHLTQQQPTYNKIFKLCFKEEEDEEIFSKITNVEEFEAYRDLIREMNNVSYERENPNPEIEKFNRYKKLYNKKTGGDISIEGIITSVEAFTGKDVNAMTIYKLYALFNRIGQFKNHDSSVLFRTVGDIEIKNWFEDVKGNKHEELDDNSKQIIQEYRNTGIVQDNYQGISQLAPKDKLLT